jgi:hypothetical protein
MPIPFLLAGLGVAAGVLGAGGHLSAKETNEKAQRISREAQEMYDEEKQRLASAQNYTEKALLALGYEKKKTLDSSMKQFLNSYDKIKHINVKDSIGLDELEKFSIDQQGAISMQKMTDIYANCMKSGATGAAAGAVVALAASGSLSVVTGGLATAGSALLAGEISAAAGIAGSALSFGAAMTPLAAVAAPVVLFTGISASIKADENLEKANTMYAQAEAACEQMKISEVLCEGITERSNMFKEVLCELDKMFSECTSLLNQVVRKKEGRFFKKKLTSADFSENDLKLIAVSRSLAGAIKAIIDTPILNNEGALSESSLDKYNETERLLPDFSEAVEDVKRLDYDTPVSNSTVSAVNNTPSASVKNTEKVAYNPNGIIKFVMWILAIMWILSGVCCLFAGVILGAIPMIIAGLIMCPKTDKTWRFGRRLLCFIILTIIAGMLM